MAMTVVKRWRARMTWRLGGGPETVFIGRSPTVVADAQLRDDLFALGVFERVGEDSLRYSSPAYLDGKSGRRYEVTADGLMAIDMSDVDVPRAVLEAELEDLTDEERTVSGR